MKTTDLALTLGRRLCLFFCLFFICYLLTAAMAYVVGQIFPTRPATALRLCALIQDVFAFIVPAVVTALLVTRRPAELLCLDRRPPLPMAALVALMAFAAIPAMDAVIYWNYNINLPAALSGLEHVARAMEGAALNTMKTMLADTGTAALVVNVLVVGIGAGVAEELIFRGCFQRLLTTAGVNPHVAIWTVAFAFSLLHMQLFGFVPRMLLGAYFGYLLLWSRSVWLPAAAHVLNNTLYVVSAWMAMRRQGLQAFDDTPGLWPTAMAMASAAAAAVILVTMYKLSKHLRD